MHTLLVKDFHGKVGLAIGRFATRFGLELPYVNKLTSYCPDNLPHTFLFARLCGFKHVGAYPLQWVVKGISYAMKAVEIKKEDLCHC